MATSQLDLFATDNRLERKKAKDNFERVLKEITGTDKIRFDGSDYSPKYDDVRLSGQILRVHNCMKDAEWRTLDEIAEETGDPHASISAQLRHLRKKRFGSHTVNKRSRGERIHGLFEYQLILNHLTTDRSFSPVKRNAKSPQPKARRPNS